MSGEEEYTEPDFRIEGGMITVLKGGLYRLTSYSPYLERLDDEGSR